MKKMIYGANKRIHAIKFQSVVAPDGQIAMLDGPYEGRKNDSGILEDSELLISRKNLKLYITCTLLRNVHSCFYGCSTSNCFEMDPPIIMQFSQ